MRDIFRRITVEREDDARGNEATSAIGVAADSVSAEAAASPSAALASEEFLRKYGVTVELSTACWHLERNVKVGLKIMVDLRLDGWMGSWCWLVGWLGLKKTRIKHLHGAHFLLFKPMVHTHWIKIKAEQVRLIFKKMK